MLTLLSPVVACTPSGSTLASGFVEPNPATYVSLAPVLWKYFYHRKAAVLSGDLDAFYTLYPDLAAGADPEPPTKALTSWTGISSRSIMNLSGSRPCLTISKS